jgi:hypothetical protein
MAAEEDAMADTQDDRLASGKLDLVPMIDCIMLLLLFFILTIKFVPEEQAIGALLPTKQGQTQGPPIEPKHAVDICIYPAGLERGMLPSDYEGAWRAAGNDPERAWLRIGTAEPIAIDATVLRASGGPAVEAALARVHTYIAEALARAEIGAGTDRTGESPVTIRCFSGLSWAHALVAYDACRAYEARFAALGKRERPLDGAREVDFAPPQIRDSSRHELGEELYGIVNPR